MFAREFFDLQFAFAERAHVLSGMPLDRALLQFTNFHVRFGLGREHDGQHERWRAYAAGLDSSAGGRDWTYRFYLSNAEANTMPAVAGVFGCFSYALIEGDVARLHFRNSDGGDGSPLSKPRLARRRAELAALFGHLKASVGDTCSVKGSSWLYNLDVYRALFPSAYTASRTVVPGRFQSMSLWGQLLDHRGRVKPTLQRSFTHALGSVSSIEGLSRCFPLEVLEVRARVRAFYEFYGL